MIVQNEEERKRKKTMKQSEVMAFTSQLFYFTIKVLVCFIFYKYKNQLWMNIYQLCTFICFLIINAYLILTTGNDPGFEPLGNSDQENNNLMSQEITDVTKPQNQNKEGEKVQDQNICKLCLCKMRNRMKHCYRCGRCTRKYDHHCPWIGTCVGENNHFKFLTMTFFQTLQALFTFWIFFTSLKLYHYQNQDGSYGQEYGVFSMFSFFMFIYIIFVSGLFFFHLFLLMTNITTKQLLSRGKAKYLKGLKGNPFSKGIIQNIRMSICIPPEGHFWEIQHQQRNSTRSFWSKLWQNQYYHCC